MSHTRKHNWASRFAMATAAVLLLAAPAMASDAGGEKGFQFGDLGQAIAALVIFGILVFILGKWGWKPIVTQLENREKQIADTIANAQTKQQEAERLLEEYRSQLASAQAQAEALMGESRREAATAREQILQAAQADAKKTVQQTLEEIERAKQETLRELYDSTASIATELAGKIIRRNLRVEDQKQILAESLEEIRQKANRG